MSNKLTREVVYLSESDRPKKVEPLSFYDWMRKRFPSYNISDEWHERTLNLRATEYATYLQEFSAEEVGVEFTHESYDATKTDFKPTELVASEYDNIIYRGRKDGVDYFIAFDNYSYECIGLFKGHINSGKF